jgi:DNA-binding CsgD family transcriptional regulator
VDPIASRRRYDAAVEEDAAVAAVMTSVLGAELAELPRVLLAALAEVVPVHHAGWYEVDPRVPKVAVTRHPDGFNPPQESIDAGILRHGEHPVAAHHAATGTGAATRISDLMTQEEYRATDYYRQVSAPVSAEYEMAFRLPGPDPLQVVVVLSRSEHDFSDAERDLCELLRGLLALALRGAARAALLRQALDHRVSADPGAAMVGCEEQRLTALDSRAETLLDRLQVDGGLTDPRLLTWLEEARAGDPLLGDPVPHRHRTTWADEKGTIEIRHVPGHDGRDLLVVRRLDTDTVAVLRALGLRPREAEVLAGAMAGETNREIARRLGIAPATVKKHLESVYRTLGVSNRTAAAAAGFRAVDLDTRHSSP